jgi:hypothetical protein
LDTEFAEYQAKLNEQIEKVNDALERNRGKIMTDEETNELKKLYRAIVKALHPDLNPDLGNAKLQLFHRAVEAYESGDLNGLRIIGAMVSEPVLSEARPDGLAVLVKKRERLYGLLRSVKDGIEEIKAEYPYTMKSFVQNPAKVKARKAELEKNIDQLKGVHAAFTAKIAGMLR